MCTVVVVYVVHLLGSDISSVGTRQIRIFLSTGQIRVVVVERVSQQLQVLTSLSLQQFQQIHSVVANKLAVDQCLSPLAVVL